MTKSLSASEPIIVTDKVQLAELCSKWSTLDALALDTEFVRTNTFFPKVGLLQLADKEHCYLIDPLSISDWSEFCDLITNPDVSIVLHSCSEDLGLLNTFLGVVPASVFDTQLAAAYLGLGFSISYQALVREIAGVDIPKEETRSDWLHRPLSDKQLQYAAADVLYLLDSHDFLTQNLEEKGFLGWFRNDCDLIIETAKARDSEKYWDTYYKDISKAWHLNETGLKTLQKLCYWREQVARERDKPRNWILKNAELYDIAEYLSSGGELSTSSLATLTQIDRRCLQRYSAAIVDTLLDESIVHSAVDHTLLNNPLSAGLRKKLKDCQKLVQEKAEQLGIAPELLGRKRQLLELVKNFSNNDRPQWPVELSGWRRTVLEAGVEQIMAPGVDNHEQLD
jgi:ribonuclease D